MTNEGKDLKELYQLEARKQYKGKVILGDVILEVILFFKDKRRRDVDNYNKLVLDSLEGVVYEDDKQIQKLTVEKRISAEDPRVEIKISFKK
ncbi:RusA family crossover junction endodeoxyribonuclease [Candidatus Parcubacteria bacterium]|nr:RusA family crossover junction endodeoxyribonuclease [Candidatus Parcubacteria bacterium]